jgi:hypothetical protein
MGLSRSSFPDRGVEPKAQIKILSITVFSIHAIGALFLKAPGLSAFYRLILGATLTYGWMEFLFVR